MVVVNAGGHAAHAQLKLFVVTGEARLTALIEFALKRAQLGQAVAGVAGQTSSGGISPHALGIIGSEKQLADRGQMQRGPAADGAHHLHARSLAVGALHIHNLITLAQAQIDGLLDQLVQLAHGLKRRIPDAESGLDQIAQLQQAHAQPVAAGLWPIHEATDGEVVENAVCG